MTDQQYTNILNRYNTLIDPVANNGTTPAQHITSFIASASQATVTLGVAPSTNTIVAVFVNLLQKATSTFSVASDVVTFNPVLTNLDQVSIVYYA